MDNQVALEIVRALAEGVDPLTGEVLPDDHLCNKGPVVRALNVAAIALEKKARSSYLPANAGKPWTTEEEQKLGEMFDSHVDAKTICSELGRTRGSIAARLVRMEKISSRDEFLYR